MGRSDEPMIRGFGVLAWCAGGLLGAGCSSAQVGDSQENGSSDSVPQQEADADLDGGGSSNVTSTGVNYVCFLGWHGSFEYEASELHVEACWNDVCSGPLSTPVVDFEVLRAENAATVAAEEVDCDQVHVTPDGHSVRLPCGSPGEPYGENQPWPSPRSDTTNDGCSFSGQGDFGFLSCARPTESPNEVRLNVLVYPVPYLPGQGQDRLQNGDELTLNVRNLEGEALVDVSAVIDEYTWFGDEISGCRTAGFDLEGNRRN